MPSPPAYIPRDRGSSDGLLSNDAWLLKRSVYGGRSLWRGIYWDRGWSARVLPLLCRFGSGLRPPVARTHGLSYPPWKDY
jgi:hypothetical protein